MYFFALGTFAWAVADAPAFWEKNTSKAQFPISIAIQSRGRKRLIELLWGTDAFAVVSPLAQTLFTCTCKTAGWDEKGEDVVDAGGSFLHPELG